MIVCTSLSREHPNPRPGFLGNPILKGNIDYFKSSNSALIKPALHCLQLLACDAESEQDENRTGDSRVSAEIWQESGGIWRNLEE